MPQTPRGLRNNNPLNIEHSNANPWLGLDNPPSDGRFCRFVSMDYGVRAAALLLMNYYDRDGLRTISRAISKWAPASENDTAAYIAAVANHSGLPVNLAVDMHDRDVMARLIAAMAKHENGVAIDEIALNRGLALAGFAPPVTAGAVITTPTMISATAVAAPAVMVGTLAVIDEVVRNIDIVPSIVTAIGGPAAGGVALGLSTAATWGWALYNRIRVRRENGI